MSARALAANLSSRGLLPLIVLTLLFAGCVSSTQVPREDVRGNEQGWMLQAIMSVAEEEGFVVETFGKGGSYVKSQWRPAGDQALEKVTFRLAQTSLGLALSVKVELAEANEDGSLLFQEKRWKRVNNELSRKEREAALGESVRERWGEIKREAAREARSQ